MIPAHTVFLLQFAKHRPDCAAKAAAASRATESAYRGNTPEVRVSPLRRLLGLGRALPVKA
jgi:hypothetical protein